MSNPVFNRSPVFRTSSTTVYEAPYNPELASNGHGVAWAVDRGDSVMGPSGADVRAMVNPQVLRPPAERGPMTYDDVLIKSVGMLAVLLVGATVGWLFVPMYPILFYLGAGVGLVTYLINTFRREPSPVMITVYAAAEGLFVGGVSVIFEARWSGIVLQAVIATIIVFATTLMLFASGKVRASNKMARIVGVAAWSYLFYAGVNIVLVLTGVVRQPFGLDSLKVAGIPLGVIVGVVMIVVAACFLILSFDMIKRGVEQCAPARYAWTAAFGLLVDLVYLYLQILRVLAILRNN
ncbi:MAG: Bax inhibitor-1/YccA family protein [Bifidobacteriaceae bacterium]|jgi:uncharacterized YccA/Bax inhibitor family protein|nr:Bax inhibitor-1/YccA family protein [Bifidobacteriaceae bacterium]